MANEIGGYFIAVADDVGQHPSVNRGVFRAAEQGAISAADVMMATQWSGEACTQLKRNYPDVNVGLHIEVFPEMHPLEASPKVFSLRGQRNKPSELIIPLVRQTRDQLHRYQDRMGNNPLHISTHDHAHLDLSGKIYEDFLDVLGEEMGSLSTSVIRQHHTTLVRHTTLTSMQQGEAPLTPAAFGVLLASIYAGDKAVELCTHPGMNDHPDKQIQSDFTLDMRARDLDSLLAIASSRVVELTGYTFSTPDQYASEVLMQKLVDTGH